MKYEVLTKILPPAVWNALTRLNADKLCEVRLRSGRAVTVHYNGEYRYLSPQGVTNTLRDALVLREEDIKQILVRACDKSLYAVNDKIRHGYLTLAGGLRMGIAGETVFEGQEVKTVKNFTALNIRIPHEIRGCADKVMPYVKKTRGYRNTLIISPPGAGKTTLLRDMARFVATDGAICNVLIVDERDEIAATYNGKALLDVGQNADVISGCTKAYAFAGGIRAMRPDVIVTDELCDQADADAVADAIAGGVCVFASIHADDCRRIADKPICARLLQNKCFGRYVVLAESGTPGKVVGIYDEDMRLLSGERSG